MKLNKKGFTLVELIGALVILSLLVTISTSVFINVRNSALEKEYNNLVLYLETKAVEYASNNDITLVSVGDLIKEGYIDPDDETDIYDPRNNKSLNCNLIKLEFTDGEYIADFLEDENKNDDGSCKEYIKYSDYQICYMDNDECKDFSSDKWFSDNITLGISKVKEIDTKYSWQTNKGDYSNDAYVKTKINTVGEVYYSCKIQDGNNIGDATKLVKIDKEKPTVTNVSMDEGWTINKEIVITASDGIGSGVKDYGYGKNECTYQSSNKIVLKDNGNYKLCVRDNVGNVYEFNKEITTIDTEPPVVTSKTFPTIYEGDSYDITKYFDVKCPITGCKSTTYNYKNTNVLKAGTHTITITVVANNGKSATKSISLNILPKITAKIASDIIEGTNKTVKDYFTIKCSSSGCKTTCNYENTKNLVAGTYTLTCETSWNNKLKSKASTTLKVLPKTPQKPTVKVTLTNASGATYSGAWTNKDVYFSLSPSKSTDKVTKYIIYFGSNIYKEVTATNNKASFTYSNNISTVVYVQACNGTDCSGKTTGINLKIDKVTPTIKAKTISNILVGTSNTVSDYFTTTCGNSKCTTTCNPTTTKNLTVGTHTLKCTIKSNAGSQASASAKITVNPLTPSVPKVEVKLNNASGATYTSNSWTNQSLYFKFSVGKSGDVVTYYNVYFGTSKQTTRNATSNTATWTYGDSSQKIVYVEACNVTGCSKKTSAININIDKNAPTCRLSVTTSKISFSSKSSDVVSYGVSTSSTASYGTTSMSIAKKTFYGHVLDRAGNTGTCKAEVTGTTEETNTYSCSYECGDYEASCEYVCYRDMTSSELASGKCSGAATEGAYNTCWKWHSSSSCSSAYPNLDKTGTTCSGSTYVPKTCPGICTDTDYTCSSGYTKINKKYCYKLS